MKRTATALTLLLVAGCIPPQPWERPEAIDMAQTQGRKPGTIRPGDTMQYVQTQWGAPYDVDRSTFSDGTVTEWWQYCALPGEFGYGCRSLGSSVHFVDGKVDSIHQ
jgi:hypothetical protein